jgi:hypothetical protein
MRPQDLPWSYDSVLLIGPDQLIVDLRHKASGPFFELCPGNDIDTAGGKDEIVDHEVVDRGGITSFPHAFKNSSTILTEFIIPTRTLSTVCRHKISYTD